MKKLHILILTLLAASSLLLPADAFASSTQLCWERDKCLKQRDNLTLGTLSKKELSEGFIQNSETIQSCNGKTNAANVPLGYCLPVGQGETSISFGGRRRFSNMGEFIAFIYRYGTWAASIIAVFMIVVAGVQWTASGGNSALIDSAKKRIGGAVIGLLLLVLSYTVLNLINPYLVNFRLPNVWMVNEQDLAPPTCSQLRDDQKILLFSKAGENKSIAEKDKFYNKHKNSKKFKEIKGYDGNGKNQDTGAICGNEYLVEKAGTQTCMGTKCGSEKVCGPYDLTGKGKKVAGFNCLSGQIVLHLKMADFLSTIWQNGVFQNIPWSGALSGKTLEAPDWLAIDNTIETKEIHYKCAAGWKWVNSNLSTGHLWLDRAGPNQKAGGGFMATTMNFNEYEMHYEGFEKIRCPNGIKPEAFLLKHELDLDVDSDEPHIFIGRIPGSEQAVLGTYEQVEHFAIPYKDAINGFYMAGQLDDNVISAVADDDDSMPPQIPAPKPSGPGSNSPTNYINPGSKQ